MKINIGTTKGNIVGHEISKRFINIKYPDIRKIVDKELNEQVIIIGWTPTNKRTQKRQSL